MQTAIGAIGAVPRAAARRRMVAAPADAAAMSDALRDLADGRAIFRLFRHLATLGTAIDGDVLRRAIDATRAIDGRTLSRFANLEKPEHPLNLPFVAAALLVHKRLDLGKISAEPQLYNAMRDNLERGVALLAERTLPSTVRQALEIMVGKQHICAVLRRAGYVDLVDGRDFNLSNYLVEMRRTLYGRRMRGFNEQWTFAIGHMVLLAYLIKGQAAGMLDFDAVKIWKGQRANEYLWQCMLGLSTDVEVVAAGTVFGENHFSRVREWVGDRFVDCFEACGIVADQAGDEHGAILSRPEPTHPQVARFLARVGLSQDDRIVTLHCREGGYRGSLGHDLRNADVTGYLPALRALTDRGYRVVRLGDETMTPLPTIPGVYDYALSPLKSAELDVLLPGIARFHIGSSSGLSLVPLLFGTPCLFLNWYPFDMLPWGRRNWTVLKPIGSLRDGRRVVDREAYSTLGLLREPPLLRAFGHQALDLHPAEVERAVLGFIDAVEEPGAEPAKAGRNIGRILVADDAGELRDLQ